MQLCLRSSTSVDPASGIVYHANVSSGNGLRSYYASLLKGYGHNNGSQLGQDKDLEHDPGTWRHSVTGNLWTLDLQKAQTLLPSLTLASPLYEHAFLPPF